MPNYMPHNKITQIKAIKSGYNPPPATLIGTQPLPILGGGVDSATGFSKLTCLKPATTSYQGGIVEFNNFANSMTFEELVTIGSQYNGSFFDLLILGFSKFNQFVNTITKDNYSQSFYFMASAILPTAVYNFWNSGFGINALNNFGQGAYLSGNFRQSCGDQFYSQENLGAGLFVAFKAQFSSQNDATVFNQGMNAYSIIGFLDIVEKAYSVATEYNLNGNLIIMAYQIGGNPALLGQALDPDGNYVVTSCSTLNVADCQTAVAQILNFANTEFQTQINTNSTGQPTGNPFAYSFGTTNFTSLGLEVEASPLNSIIEAEIDLALVEYGTWQIYSQTLQSVLQSPVFAYSLPTLSSYYGFLTESFTNVTTNIGLITDPIYGLFGCLQDPQNCGMRLNFINGQLQSLATTTIDNIVSSLSNGYKMTLSVPMSSYETPNMEFILANMGNNVLVPINSYSNPMGGIFNAMVNGFNLSVIYNSSAEIFSPEVLAQLWMSNYPSAPNHELNVQLKPDSTNITLVCNSSQCTGLFPGVLYLVNEEFETVNAVGLTLTPLLVTGF
jgi:hypothetical protein